MEMRALLPGEYIQVCSIHGCGNMYVAYSKHTMCPNCFCTEHDVDEKGTNDREEILYDILEKVE